MSEWSILIALFRATVEQKGFLQGETKQHAKLLFNRWEREGDKLVNLIESMSNEEELERITEVIEEAVHKLRESERKIY
jgi:hypothetical protein